LTNLWHWAVTYVTICPFSSKDTMVAINPLRSARLSAAHASTLRIRKDTYLIMSNSNPYENLNEEHYDIGRDDPEALCMLSHVLTTKIETGKSNNNG
ncbi:hypothetical protein PIROE2DRAFT_13115, partial [Piromyces sp. E2]